MSPPAAIPSLRARLTGAVWGHLVGDAAGVPYEFRPPEQIGTFVFGASGTHGQPPGTWSDDGALMLALLDSLTQAGFDPEDQGRRICAWYRSGAYAPGGLVFDVGNTTLTAIRALEAGVPALQAGPTGQWSNSNGSLMRVLPLALVGRDMSDAELIAQARRASCVTHGALAPQLACALYVLTVRELLRGAAPLPALTRAALAVQGTLVKPHEADLLTLDELWRFSKRSGDGYIADSFHSAFDAFAGAANYVETIERAIRFGHDTDTTAAIAGGLAGAYFGLNAIPVEWLERMRGGEIVTPLLERLLAGVDPDERA